MNRENIKNIWGLKGCEDPNGNLCKACCEYHAIDMGGFGTGPYKKGNAPCKLHKSQIDGGQGCGEFPRFPLPCARYRCEDQNPKTKFDLIVKAYQLEDVSYEQAWEAIGNIEGLPFFDPEEVFERTVENLRRTQGKDAEFAPGGGT